MEGFVAFSVNELGKQKPKILRVAYGNFHITLYRCKLHPFGANKEIPTNGQLADRLPQLNRRSSFKFK